MEEIKDLLEELELIKKEERYWLYFKKETSEIYVYSVEEDDIWNITIEELGDMGFC